MPWSSTITFGMRDQIEIMRSRGVKITEVRASGGGALSPFWRQMQADMYNLYPAIGEVNGELGVELAHAVPGVAQPLVAVGGGLVGEPADLVVAPSPVLQAALPAFARGLRCGVRGRPP